MDISVAILTANRNHLLQQLLTELTRQITPQDEVIVLDTADNSRTRQLLQTYPSPQFQYHQYPHQQFDFATARNHLITLAGKTAIAFIDDDALPAPGWLDRIRANLQTAPASGGPTLPAEELPDWWNPDINWTIGLSPPGTALGLPGFYPDTCNLAALRSHFEKYPFGAMAPQSTQHLYAGGREDAEWWKHQRIHGIPVKLDPRQIVRHPVHYDRLNLPYITRRAQMDGEAFWRRNPILSNATDSPWDLAHIAGINLDNYFQHNNSGPVSADAIWLHREWGQFRAVWNAPRSLRPSRFQLAAQLAKAAAFQAKIRLGSAFFQAQKMLRTTHPPSPNANLPIFVSADCQLGDTVLLRRHINALAHKHPHRKILVSARFPRLLAGLPSNVSIHIPTDREILALKSTNIERAIAPYYAYGNYQLWRSQLSRVGKTFNCDVGFPGRRDYIYANRVITKDLTVHEHENLARLFDLTPADYVPTPAAPYPDSVAVELHQLLESHDITEPYNLIQLGAGYASKEWPLDKWLPFLEILLSRLQVPVIILGDSQWQAAGDRIVEHLKTMPVPILNLAGKTSIHQLMAIIDKASLLISGCSGPKHIAYMYGTPTYTLYGPTEPYRWGASEDTHLHAYSWPLGQPLTSMELKGLDEHHRINLIQPDELAESVIAHYTKLENTPD